MSLGNLMKKHANKLPIGLRCGGVISKLDYKYRPGISSSYRKSIKDLDLFNSYSQNVEELIFIKVKNIVNYAMSNTKFYHEFYNDNGFNVDCLNSFIDISRIPIVTKSDLRAYNIEDITCMKRSDLQLSNTGGSTGKPFNFYITSDAMGHEWAHVHHIWSKLGFSPSDLKAILAGRSNVKNYVEYDMIRHSLSVDIYSDFDFVAEKIMKFSKIEKIKYLHGYPSAIFEFASYCEKNREILDLLKSSLKGVFLTSEYPHGYFRNKIEEVFEIKTQSFYGHTERCIIAYEKDEKENFFPLHSYGFCEIENNELVGTAYHSYGTPLIRYATGDIVKNYKKEANGIVSSFVLEEGRTGEFILDKGGKKIPLTALIFGRHHELFNYVTHIQVFQKYQGYVSIIFCPKSSLPKKAVDLFDANNVNVEFDFIEVKEPIKTISGKFKLLVDRLPNE
ncbi:hypothetical protein [Vibrio parahaemolyticus]|uniref:hypothetical protein n=1 Tax=Vibrio parahaemolyticus TaxID=670 RepID=UPI001122E3A4|nr:hypothetical protein [Vibrio parahaemolyticus]TOI80452.1 hypothetical protein CGI54_17495 [Vibrio parahaemolyticus]